MAPLAPPVPPALKYKSKVSVNILDMYRVKFFSLYTFAFRNFIYITFYTDQRLYAIYFTDKVAIVSSSDYILTKVELL